MALTISPSPFGTLSVTVAETQGSITVNTVPTAPAVLSMALGVPGPAGAAGANGANGADGQPGVGVPAGGATGQALVKTSGTDYATGWASINSAAWGNITGTISSQTDLKSALDGKLSTTGGTMSTNANVYFGQPGNNIWTTQNINQYQLIAVDGEETTTITATDILIRNNDTNQITVTGNGITFNTYEGPDLAKYQPTGITFPDSTVQTTAGLPLTGGTMANDASIVSVSTSEFGISTTTITGNSVSCFDPNNNATVTITGSGVNWGSGYTSYDSGIFSEFFTTNYDAGSHFTVSSYEGIKLTGTASSIKFGDNSIQTTAFIPSNYLTASSIASTYLSQSSAAATYFPKPTGTTSQYIDGTGGLVTFPTVGTAGKMTLVAYNATGATIPQGSVVYISGAHGNDPQVSLAKADSEATSAFTIAVAQSAVPNNSNGTFITTGLLEGFATNGFGADGTPLYLSPTVAGGLTATKPFAPYHYVRVGTVVRSHPTAGTVFISIINGFQLDEMSDVASTAPLNNNVLTFETSSGMWKDKSISTALGYAPANQTLGNLTSSSTARTNLGLGTMAVETASNYLTASSTAGVYLSQSSAASTYQPISGMSSYLTTATAASVYTTKANNLSDLASASTARTNLGLAYATDAQVIAGTSASTVMTPAQSQFGIQNWVIPSTLSTAVSTGTVTSTGYGSRCQLTATASGQYAIVYPSNGSIATFTNSGANTTDSNFSKRIKIYGRVYCSMTANLNAYFAWGRSNNTPSTIGSPAVKGFGIRIQGTGAVELQVHNGTTLTNVTSSFTPTTNQLFDCLIDSIGDGNVNLYINGSLAATSSAGPTGTQSGYPLLIQELSSIGSSTVGNFYVTGKALYFA